VQAQWIKEFYSIALSKPFIESITWNDLTDQPNNLANPNGGLLHGDLSPKLGFKSLVAIRGQIHAVGRKPPATRGQR
jgi:hypothetical protein